CIFVCFFFSSRRRHTRFSRDWSSDVCSSDLEVMNEALSRQELSTKDAAVYIQITRGVAPRTHFIPEDINPTILLYAYPVTLEGLDRKSVRVGKECRCGW